MLLRTHLYLYTPLVSYRRKYVSFLTEKHGVCVIGDQLSAVVSYSRWQVIVCVLRVQHSEQNDQQFIVNFLHLMEMFRKEDIVDCT